MVVAVGVPVGVTLIADGDIPNAAVLWVLTVSLALVALPLIVTVTAETVGPKIGTIV